jgi:protein-tyrosine kinase
MIKFAHIKNKVEEMARKYLPPEYVLKKARADDGIDCRVAAHTDRSSHVAEQYKAIRTNLYALSSGNKIKTVVITSSQAGEGKTVTSCNLAVTISHDTAKRVLLVDADMRHPSVSPIFNISDGPGFSDILRGSCGIEQFTARPVLGDLYVIPAGNVVDDPTDILIPGKVEPFIRKVSAQFDYVIFDTPPVLNFTDSCMLGAMCDAVILTVKAGLTQEDAIEEAITLLGEAQASPKACIMTCATDFADTQHYYRK